jgi:anti-sigma regulatory factor (Ser/Thr protein kinase)
MNAQAFQHEALFYSGRDGFLAGTVPFIEEGVAADEPTMVVVEPAKIELLRARLNSSADGVRFVNMFDVGRNPALIISAWQDFVSEHAGGGRRLRGIGEPIGPERSPAELVECQHHESLLNLAFDDGPPWRLMCPYDADRLAPEVLEVATHNHRMLAEDGHEHPSDDYRDPAATQAPFTGPLPGPPPTAHELRFDAPVDIGVVRHFVADRAHAGGMGGERMEGFVLAIDEVVTNSLCHGGGSGQLKIWSEDRSIVAEVSDTGVISEQLVGRIRPEVARSDGRGLWIANHFCDLVQIRSSAAGTTVRCHIAASEPAHA